MKTMKRTQSGFTLIEMMIAMLVLAFGLLTVASAQVTAMQGGQNGRHLSQAVAIAQERMEFNQRTLWANLPLQGWTADAGTVDTQVETGSGQSVEQSFQIAERITSTVPGRIRAIDVRVSWNDPRRGLRSYTLSGMRYNW